MTNGILFRNSNDFVVTNGTGNDYYLWGYKDYSVSDTPNAGVDATIFNMPHNVDARYFFAFTSVPALGYRPHEIGIWTANIGGKDGFSIRSTRNNGTFSFRAYVFVPYSLVPKDTPNYGLMMFNDSQVAVFGEHERPILMPAAIQSERHAVVQTVHGTIPANAATQHKDYDVFPSNADDYRAVYYRGNTQIQLGRRTFGANPYAFGFPSAQWSFVLDADYYNQFPNLLNWDAYYP